MTPDIAAKLVSALDVELERRRKRRDADEEARWREECDDDPVVFARRYLDRLVGRFGAESPEDAAEIVLASVDDDADRARLERVEELAEWIRAVAEKLRLLEALRADQAAGIVRKAGKPKLRVRSMAKLLADVKPKLDPSAPKPAERTGRRGEAAPPLVQPGTPEDGVWQIGQVQAFNLRTHEGSIRGRDGREYQLGSTVLMNSGLVTLIVGMRCRFKAVGGVVDVVQAAWH